MEMPKRIGKYEVIEQIAVGGFGIIYKGWDPLIKRTVAIKMCATPDDEVRQRFQQEAQFVGNLVHRNITLVFDFGVENNVPYIVQEFLTGYDLDELLRYSDRILVFFSGEVIRALAPLAVSLHVKDATITRQGAGWAIRGCRLGEGQADIEGVLAAVYTPRVRRAAPRAPNGQPAN